MKLGSDFFLMLPPLFLMRSAPAIFFLCSATFLIMLRPPPIMLEGAFSYAEGALFYATDVGGYAIGFPPEPLKF